MYVRLWQSISVIENQYFFDSFNGREISCNPLAVYRELSKRKDFYSLSVVWVKRKNVPVPPELTGLPNVRFVDFAGLDYFISLTQSKYVVHNTNIHRLFAPKKEQVICATWHGIPLKALGFAMTRYKFSEIYNSQRSFNLSDVILSSGDYYDDHTFVSYGSPKDYDRIYQIGFPRNDSLVRHFMQPMARPARPKMLFVPTWRGKIGKVEDIEQKTKRVLDFLQERFGNGFDIIVKPHYFSSPLNDFQSDVSILSPGKDINGILPDIDILITDYSSICVDFLILNRPVVLLAEDEGAYRTERGLLQRLDELPFEVCRDLSQLEKAILAARRPSDFSQFERSKKMLLGEVRDDSSKQTLNIMHTHLKKTSRKPLPKSVLIFAGTFKPNGITHSFINLVNAVDPDLVQMNLVVPYTQLDQSDRNAEMFLKLPAHVQKTFVNFSGITDSTRKYLNYKGRDLAIRNGKITESLLEELRFVCRRHFRQTNFDVAVSFCGYTTKETLMIAASDARRKIVFQHNDMLAERKLRGNVSDILIESYRFFDKVVSVSPGLAMVNRDSFPKFIAPEQSAVCRNLMNPSETIARAEEPCVIADEMRRIRESMPDTPIFVSAGRFSPEKNHARLLQAFKHVLDYFPNARLWILGDGPLWSQTKSYAESLGLGQSCQFPGWIDNPFPAIKSGDAFILSSNYEGKGMVLLEAMALGKPVISCTHPSVMFIKDYGGSVVDQDWRALAVSMLKVCNGTLPRTRFDPDSYQAVALQEFYSTVLGMS